MFIRTLITLSVLLSNVAMSQVEWNDARISIKKQVVQNHRAITHYKEARRFLLQQVHLETDSRGYFIEDAYCHKVLRKSVGPRQMPRHTILNVEHTWPQSRFNKSLSRHIQKSDLHHLYPVNSRANGTRGNYYFSDVASGMPLGGCQDSSLGYVPGTNRDAFEPPADHKGNVARALFYFSIRYDIVIPAFEEIILRQWHMLDPVDSDEEGRNNKIARIQGNRNPFIDDANLVNTISNF